LREAECLANRPEPSASRHARSFARRVKRLDPLIQALENDFPDCPVDDCLRLLYFKKSKLKQSLYILRLFLAFFFASDGSRC
jgi:hypothetical protein